MVGGYLVLSTVAYAFPHRPTAWPLLVALHIGLGALLLDGRLEPLRHPVGAGPRRVPGWLRTGLRHVADWYPLILLPLLYWELPLLNRAIWGGYYFDLLVQGWEMAVFGGQPSVTAADRWSSLLLSETLHLAYLSYYPILYVFPAVVYALRGREAFLDTLFGMMLGFAVHYAVFIVFPVKGPYFVFPPPGEPQSAGALYQTVHFVLGTGASAGTAFPSSHVAVSTVQTTNAARHLRAAAPILAVCTLGIVLGAVYAGVHYAVDVAVGLVTGLTVGLLVPVVRSRLG